MAAVIHADRLRSGLGTRAARWVFVGVWFSGIAHGAIRGEFAATGLPGIIAYSLALLGALALTSPSDGLEAPLTPLPLSRALTVASCALIAGGVVLAAQPVSGVVWLFDFSGYLLALLVPQGRPVLAYTGIAALVVGAAARAMIEGAPVTGLLTMVGAVLAAGLAGSIWRRILVLIVSREVRARTAEELASIRSAATEAAEQAHRRAIDSIRDRAEPLLSAIASGDARSERFLKEVAATEGDIRDQIRAPGLRHPVLAAAVSEARRRDTAVVVLGGDRAGPIGDALAEAVSAIITGSFGESVTIRHLPPGRYGAVTVLVKRRGTTERTTLDAAGTVLPGPVAASGQEDITR